MHVELRPEDTPGAPHEQLGVWLDSARRGQVTVARDGSVPVVSLTLDEPARWTRPEIRALIREVPERVGTAFEFALSDPLFRYEARSIGFAGGLRAPLAPWGKSPVVIAASWDAQRLADAVNGLVNRTVVRPGSPPRSAVSRLMQRASSGNAASLHLSVDGTGGREFAVVVPPSSDLLVEVVALAVDTALGVVERLPIELAPLRSIAFDRSDARFVRGNRRAAGLAHQSLALVHLNASYTSADALCLSRQFRVDHPPPKPPFQTRPPVTFIDGVVAHELWHVAEGTFEGRRYRDTIELRRRIGEFLGVPSLEHAVLPRPEDGPAGQAARETLRTAVSEYATTNITEATAELFQAWWWAPDPVPPVVACFGELLAEFFPGPAVARRGLE